MAHPSLLSLLESVGLDEEMEGTLKGRGVNTVSALHAFGTQGLQTVDGIRAVQRRALISRATEVMNGTWVPSPPKPAPAPPPPPSKRRGGGFFGIFGACGCSGEPDSHPQTPPPASVGEMDKGNGLDSSAALEAALKAALMGALDIEENQLMEALKLEAEWRDSEGWQARFAAAEKSDDYDWLYVVHELQCEVLQAVGLVPSQETLSRLRDAAFRYPHLTLPVEHDDGDGEDGVGVPMPVGPMSPMSPLSPLSPTDDPSLLSMDNPPGQGPTRSGLAGVVGQRGGPLASVGSVGSRYTSVCSDTPPDEALQFAVSGSHSMTSDGAGSSPQLQQPPWPAVPVGLGDGLGNGQVQGQLGS
mmetsp:Transcript_26492/g.70931  ORF Transcript_26492/g.70931 Transcript_26492/m.70931 type:complete len:358 (-) Transcript_26492:102-1175(-)